MAREIKRIKTCYGFIWLNKEWNDDNVGEHIWFGMQGKSTYFVSFPDYQWYLKWHLSFLCVKHSALWRSSWLFLSLVSYIKELIAQCKLILETEYWGQEGKWGRSGWYSIKKMLFKGVWVPKIHRTVILYPKTLMEKGLNMWDGDSWYQGIGLYHAKRKKALCAPKKIWGGIQN